MAKSTSNDVHLENVENSEASMINFHIKQLMELKELVEDSDKKVQYWTNETSKLLQSNCNIKTYYDKLMQRVSEMDAKISENTKIHVMKKEELKTYQRARDNISRKQWDDCLSEINNYANNFSERITEYSRDVLLKDIGNHDQECKKVSEELAVLKAELDEMQKEHKLDYIQANIDVNDLSNFNNVITDIKSCNHNLIRTVNLTEDKLNKIQNKIKQSKIAINEYQAKKKKNMF